MAVHVVHADLTGLSLTYSDFCIKHKEGTFTERRVLTSKAAREKTEDGKIKVTDII